MPINLFRPLLKFSLSKGMMNQEERVQYGHFQSLSRGVDVNNITDDIHYDNITHIPGQGSALQSCLSTSSFALISVSPVNKQSSPPWEAEGLSQERVRKRLPSPHVALHSPNAVHAPQFPCTEREREGC